MKNVKKFKKPLQLLDNGHKGSTHFKFKNGNIIYCNDRIVMVQSLKLHGFTKVEIELMEGKFLSVKNFKQLYINGFETITSVGFVTAGLLVAALEINIEHNSFWDTTGYENDNYLHVLPTNTTKNGQEVEFNYITQSHFNIQYELFGLISKLSFGTKCRFKDTTVNTQFFQKGEQKLMVCTGLMYTQQEEMFIVKPAHSFEPQIQISGVKVYLVDKSYTKSFVEKLDREMTDTEFKREAVENGYSFELLEFQKKFNDTSFNFKKYVVKFLND